MAARRLALLAVVASLASFGVAGPGRGLEVRLADRTLAGPGVDPVLQQPAAVAGERRHAVLRFAEPLTPAHHEKLRAERILLLRHLENHAYTASFPAGLVLPQGVPAPLLGADALRVEDKLSADLLAGEVPSWAVEPATGKVRVRVEVFSDVTPEEARGAILEATREPATGDGPSWALVVSRRVLRALASRDEVKRIEPGPLPFLPQNDYARARSRSALAQLANFHTTRPGFRGVDGSPAAIGIFDSGIDDAHIDFDEIKPDGSAGNSRVNPKRPAAKGVHGTNVASIAAGSGLAGEANGLPAFVFRGHAPYAKLGDYAPIGESEGTWQAFAGALLEGGMHVTNHSYAQSLTVYDALAAELDQVVGGDPPLDLPALPARPQVWAAGNAGFESYLDAVGADEEGYYAVFTSAKNTLSVGSLDTGDGRPSRLSSLGPTFDGRIKPDVIAPGCRHAPSNAGIEAAAVGTSGYVYTTNCGTSMAAPAVSGALALVMHRYQKAHGGLPDLRPATYKAILVHTAIDRVKTKPYATDEWNNPDTGSPVLFHAGPDYATGWGEVDAAAAVDLVALGDRWREDELVAAGGEDRWCLVLPVGVDRVEATLAWDDLPGEGGLLDPKVPRLVNDLDLWLEGPGGAKVLPWTLEPPPLTDEPGEGGLDPIAPGDVKPAFRAADHRNNVERVTWPEPQPGPWDVVVRAHALPLASAQGYSLVTSHPLASSTPGACP